MLDEGVKKFIIVFINIVHAEMRKKATPLSQRESYSLKDFYKKLLGLTRSICGKPQRIGCVKAFQSGIFLNANWVVTRKISSHERRDFPFFYLYLSKKIKGKGD